MRRSRRPRVAVRAEIEFAPDLLGAARGAFLAVQTGLAEDVELFSLVPLDLSRPELELAFDGPLRDLRPVWIAPEPATRGRRAAFRPEGQRLRFELGE